MFGQQDKDLSLEDSKLIDSIFYAMSYQIAVKQEKMIKRFEKIKRWVENGAKIYKQTKRIIK